MDLIEVKKVTDWSIPHFMNACNVINIARGFLLIDYFKNIYIKFVPGFPS